MGEFDYWVMAQEAQKEVERLTERIRCRREEPASGAAQVLQQNDRLRMLENILREQKGNVQRFLRIAVERKQVSDKELLLFAARMKGGQP